MQLTFFIRFDYSWYKRYQPKVGGNSLVVGWLTW